MPEDDWAGWYQNNGSAPCWTMLRAMGYVGEGAKELPEFANGQLSIFWMGVFPFLNVRRQDFNTGVIRRLNTIIKGKIGNETSLWVCLIVYCQIESGLLIWESELVQFTILIYY